MKNVRILSSHFSYPFQFNLFFKFDIIFSKLTIVLQNYFIPISIIYIYIYVRFEEYKECEVFLPLIISINSK